MTLKASVSAQISAVETATLTAGSASANLGVGALLQFVNGTGAGKADLVYSAHRNLAASANENLDLTGVLTDAFGAVINSAKVKAIIIVADATNTGDLIIGAAANPFLGPLAGTTPTVAVRPGGIYLVADPNLGWTVTASTADLIKVANSVAAAAGYQIEIIAASA